VAKVAIKYSQNDPQKEFHKDISTPFLMFNGGLGSGKTYGLCMKLIKLSALNKDIAGGCLSPSFPMYKKDILPTFEEILDGAGLMDHTKIHRTDHYIIFPWTKAPLYFFTGEKAIKGPNLGYGGINEHSSIPFERVQQFIQRIRVKDAPYRQLCFAGTPEDEYAWLDDFVEAHEQTGKLRIINGKTTDNQHLAPEYIEHLRATLDPMAFRLFAEGEMLKLTGNHFYYSYSTKNHSNQEFDKRYPFYVNIDFNVGNMHASICQQYYNEQNEKVSIFVDEIVLKHSGADTYAMIDAIKGRFFGLTQNMLITCDASGRNRKTTGVSDIVALKDAFGDDAVRYRSAGNPRMRKKQLLINGLLSNGLVLVNPKKCPTLNKDLNKVLQKEDFTKDDKNKDLTHSSDGFDYYCDFEYKINDRETFNASKAR